MEASIKILHLEDNPNDSLLVQTIIKTPKVNYEYFFADNEDDFISILRNEKIDLILSDFNLPDYSGSEALLYAKNNYPDLPFVFLSGTMGEDAAIESLLNGATDYVLKSNMERVLPAVQRALNGANELKARRKAENQLLKLSRAIEQSPNSIVITDTNHIIEYVNPATFKLTGFEKAEIIGNSSRLFDAGGPENNFFEIVNTIISGKEWQGELLNRKKTGELYWSSVSISPIFNDDGVIINFIGISEDITERKKLTADLIKAKEKAEENDRLKTAFLHNISHEIRTPMNAIVGFSGFLNEPGLAFNKRKQFTDIIVQSSNQLLSIISDIIDIATIESGQEKVYATEIRLNAALRLLLEQFSLKAEKQNVKLNLNLSLQDHQDSIISDETKLFQILTNLIGNAVKFTKQGYVNIGYQIKGQELEFSIEDTGIGIPSEMFEEIFNRFSQGESTIAHQFGGSGLGLSISKAYVGLLGGKMWLASELKKGSTFYFTIPYKKGSNYSLPEIHYNSGLDLGIDRPKTILIAEDDNTNFMLLEKPLKNINIHILRAYNGVEAIEICKAEHIDLVLMDIKMPLMDGYEATKQIRTFKPYLPIIAQTAYAQETDKNKALSCGCTEFVSKPLNMKILIEKIKVYLLG
jgi:PAS domain S-box-containing protein